MSKQYNYKTYYKKKWPSPRWAYKVTTTQYLVGRIAEEISSKICKSIPHITYNKFTNALG